MVSIIAQRRDKYLSLFSDLYCDVAEKLRVPIRESQRDLIQIKNRTECEGLSFLTKALPQLGKALDKCLSHNEPFACPSTFMTEKGRTTPKLFRYLFQAVITPEGYVNPQLDTVFLTELRQLMYFIYKLEIPCSDELKEKVLLEFEQVDAGLDKPSNVDQEWLEVASDLIRDIFASFDPTDVKPSHGPGAVATGERNHEKHVFKRIYSSIERVYPFTEYFEYSLGAVADRWHLYEGLESLETPTAKVVLVPKDSRGPRIISCEPLEVQWIQQGLGRAIVAHLERNHLTGGFVNFTDQSINRNLALEGSKNHKWVTLDMKEASDRVSTWLVCDLFAKVPRLLEALLATRSTHTRLPSGRIVALKKFAPMGSCLCFPVESVCFWALAVARLVIEDRIARPNRKGNPWARARRAVYVYGDDIIVREQDYKPLLQHFPSVGLVFNSSKCCTAGSFRESCGCDAYNGVDVTPLRIKKVFDDHRTVHASVLASYVALSNAAWKRGYYRVARLAASMVETKLGPLPTTSGIRGYLSFVRPIRATQIPPSCKMRFNAHLQRMEVRSWALRSTEITVDYNAWSMILRRFTSSTDWSDPGVFAVPRRSRLHRGWSALN